jgi:general secretion pathway protein C
MTMKTWMRLVALAVGLAGTVAGADAARAGDMQHYLVIGVIASGESGMGVALLKEPGSGKTFAARAGQQLADQATIRHITRDYVYFQVGERTEKVRVGEAYAGVQTEGESSGGAVVLDQGMERQGNVVRLTASLRERLVKHDLSKVLMQAAAVPYYVNGELNGFRLWEIDPGSLYEKAGFSDGDIITAINGQPLVDVGQTIRMLQSMRDETRADITFLRKGAEQTLQIMID